MDRVEITFRIIELAIAGVGIITGVALVVFGIIVPRNVEVMRKKHEDTIERARWKKEHIDRQISNLYGPLYALIIEGEITLAHIHYQLGRKSVFPDGVSFSELPSDEQRIWSHYVDTYKIKSQIKMSEIIRDNLHLIYKSEFPTCFKVFLDYSLGWELLDNQRRCGVPNYYEYHYVFNFPEEFTHYVQTTFKILLNKQSSLSDEPNTKSANISIQ